LSVTIGSATLSSDVKTGSETDLVRDTGLRCSE